ncbi:fimbrial protein, partial [Salmonella enterica subsp. enterica serovar Corvallis]
MQQLLFLLRQPSLMLLMGLTGGFWSGISQAGSNLDINLTASIVNSTCKLSLENGGEVYLPNVTRAWFYNNDGSSKYAPTDEAGGTPFNVRLEDCADNSSIK